MRTVSVLVLRLDVVRTGPGQTEADGFFQFCLQISAEAPSVGVQMETHGEGGGLSSEGRPHSDRVTPHQTAPGPRVRPSM